MTLERLPSPVQGLVLAMWRTAMSCGEAAQFRTRDVDMSGEVWIFRPTHHKTHHRGGKERVIPIGKAAQDARDRLVRQIARIGGLNESTAPDRLDVESLPWRTALVRPQA